MFAVNTVNWALLQGDTTDRFSLVSGRLILQNFDSEGLVFANLLLMLLSWDIIIELMIAFDV